MFNKQKLDDYFEEFITVAIKNRGHLEVFLGQLGDKMLDSEKEYIRDLWEIETLNVPEDEDEVTEERLLDMTKDEIEDYAIEEFGVDLDKRHNIADLIEEVIELKENKED
jgi:hypothetical protein